MGTTCGSSYLFSRLLFLRILVVLGLVCFLVFGCLGSSDGRTRKLSAKLETLKHEQAVNNNNEELDFNYMSKRKVPNGPDPIHNRRAGNSGRPPGQA